MVNFAICKLSLYNFKLWDVNMQFWEEKTKVCNIRFFIIFLFHGGNKLLYLLVHFGVSQNQSPYLLEKRASLISWETCFLSYRFWDDMMNHFLHDEMCTIKLLFALQRWLRNASEVAFRLLLSGGIRPFICIYMHIKIQLYDLICGVEVGQNRLLLCLYSEFWVTVS